MPTTFINGLLVLPQELGGPQVAPLRFDGRRILSIGQVPRRNDRVLDLVGYIIYPGLINAHDHLELNHFPRSKFRDVYTNAQQWSEDFQPRLEEEPYRSLRRLPLDQRCVAGGIKNLQSGVTTVAHHNPLHKPLRRNFAVRVVQHYGWAHSFYLEPDIAGAFRRTPRSVPWMIHLAEGTDEAASHELHQLDSLGCLQENTVLIHGVGLSEADRWRTLDAGAGLVWCPSTNLYLLGKTGDVRQFVEANRLAIGTDSRLTADGDMLDELKAAYATGQITPEQIFRAVTADAARLLRLRAVGILRPGFRADFLIVPVTDEPDPHRRLIALTTPEISAVYIDGVPRFGNHEFFNYFGIRINAK